MKVCKYAYPKGRCPKHAEGYNFVNVLWLGISLLPSLSLFVYIHFENKCVKWRPNSEFSSIGRMNFDLTLGLPVTLTDGSEVKPVF